MANDSKELCENKCFVLLMTSQLSRLAEAGFVDDTLTLDEWSTRGSGEAVRRKRSAVVYNEGLALIFESDT